MKNLLTGVAVAAALAIAAPVWAQTPMTPSAPAKSATAPAPAPAAAAAPKQKHRAVRQARSPRGTMKSGDAMTQQLNRQELARIQGGPGTAPMAAPPAMQGPRPSSAH
jgi:hypothetical protein